MRCLLDLEGNAHIYEIGHLVKILDTDQGKDAKRRRSNPPTVPSHQAFQKSNVIMRLPILLNPVLKKLQVGSQTYLKKRNSNLPQLKKLQKSVEMKNKKSSSKKKTRQKNFNRQRGFRVKTF